jgi:2-haloacid dehalogenase
MNGAPQPEVVLFDVFGTTVDVLGSLNAFCQDLGKALGLSGDWASLVKEWKLGTHDALQPIVDGERPWARYDEVQRERLDSLLPKYGLNAVGVADRDRMVDGWKRLAAWPDTVEGLMRLKQSFILGAFSNGTTRLLADMAKFSKLPWDLIIGSDLFHTYKTAPGMYQGAIEVSGAPPERILLVAAHNNDLQAAREHGIRTAFIHRSTEDPEPGASCDFVASDFPDLAAQLQA